MSEARQVGEEARKVHHLRLQSGFVGMYLSGEHVLDIGYKGYIQDVVPIVPQAIGIELDYPGYDGRTLPFEENSQDAVFASHCLEHIPDFVQALRDWHRVLRKGGFMVIMVPHQFLYEKRIALPSRYNADHQRFYTPASLMADIEGALPPNSYRLRHLADNDRFFDYTIPPERHAGGCYEIELVIEKIEPPLWSLVTQDATLRAQTDFDALRETSARNPVHERHGGTQQVRILQASPWDVALYDFGHKQPARRRIMAVQLGHLGDFIIGLPALRELRNAFPDDQILLVTGSWNRGAAESCGLVDEVATHDYFPEIARGWNGEPVQTSEDFVLAAPGYFDIAIDLRIDEDTRHLLQHVDAGLRCGVGATDHFPFLDVALPIDQAQRSTDSISRSLNLLLGPERFSSRMPVQTSFCHKTDFSVTDTHVIYGPYLRIPVGRFRAAFGLQTTGFRLDLKRASITLDVVQDGSNVLASRELSADQVGDIVDNGLNLDFVNLDDRSTCEFRIHVRGRPRLGKLIFSGVRLDQQEALATARFRRADLHIGEQQSLLVQLLADRTHNLYPTESPPPYAQAVSNPYRIVIAPASNSDLRDWPVQHYAALTCMLVENLNCTIELIGSRSQTGALTHIAQTSNVGSRVINLAGRTAWADLPELLRDADLVICNNSGIAHLAASLGCRTLAIYSASHQPQEWGPRGTRSRALMAVLPCSPCGYDTLAQCPHDHACMQGLLPEFVFDRVAEWLRDN